MAREGIRNGKNIFVSFLHVLFSRDMRLTLPQVLDPDDVPEQDCFIRCSFMVRMRLTFANLRRSSLLERVPLVFPYGFHMKTERFLTCR